VCKKNKGRIFSILSDWTSPVLPTLTRPNRPPQKRTKNYHSSHSLLLKSYILYLYAHSMIQNKLLVTIVDFHKRAMMILCTGHKPTMHHKRFLWWYGAYLRRAPRLCTAQLRGAEITKIARAGHRWRRMILWIGGHTLFFLVKFGLIVNWAFYNVHNGWSWLDTALSVWDTFNPKYVCHKVYDYFS